MITIRKSAYTTDDLNDLFKIFSDGYNKFIDERCSKNINCEICCKYYLCKDIYATLSHLEEEIAKRTPANN